MQSHYHYPQARLMERPRLLWVAVGALVLVGIGALPAGYALISDPTGAMIDLPASMLNSPFFPDYLVPGLFLFFVNGVGSLAAAAALLFRPQWRTFARINPMQSQEWTWSLGVVMGVILMAWIVIQYVSVTIHSILQPAIFGAGLLIVASLMAPSVRSFFRAR